MVMKAMMFLPGRDEPAAIFDEIKIVTMNDNHKVSPVRIFYKSNRLNASKIMVELFRDNKMLLKLEDGREAQVMLQHNSLDMEGNAVGVLRVLGDMSQ